MIGKRWLILLVPMALMWTLSQYHAARAQQAGATADSPATVLTLLGTAGGPGGRPDRAGIASVVSVGDRHYLVDAGTGVSHQVARAGIDELRIANVFLTHLHDDHTAGLPSLMTFAYTRRAPSMAIHGPPGTYRLVEFALAYLGVNATMRDIEAPGQLRPLEAVFTVSEIAPGQVFDDGLVTVSAVENTHLRRIDGTRDGATRSYSYRFETPDRTIVFTGDTGPSEAVETLARGADILVSEIASAADVERVPAFAREHMLNEHLTPAEVGRLASKAGVKTVVLSHFQIVAPTDVEEIRRHFGGRVVVGEDLARF